MIARASKTPGMATRREKIIAKAIELLKVSPDGIRYSDLVKKYIKNSREFPLIPFKVCRDFK